VDSQHDWRRQRMDPRDSGGSRQQDHGGTVRAPGGSGATHDPGFEPDVDPPWERPSGLYPAVKPAQQTAKAPNPLWELESMIERSYPGTSIETLMNTGTGKVPAAVPLQPGRSIWSAGLSAPSAIGSVAAAVPEAAELDVDEQPSIQMRALSSGNLARATIIVTSALMLSRVLGLLRTSLFASVFGSTADTLNADAFTNAFAFPDMLFTIVAGGALASAFIPVFTSYLVEKRDRKAAWRIASSALNIIMTVLVLLAILGIIFTRQFLELTLPEIMQKTTSEPETLIELTRIMLLQPIFLGGATITIAILQARQSFVLPALGQVIYTVSLILGILATRVDETTHIFGGHLGIAGPAWGVVLGALLQFVIQVPGLTRAKMQYTFSFDIFNPGIREMFRLMAPRLLNAVILYLSVFVNRNLLGTLNINGVTYGYVTAFALIMLPNGIFGMAVSQAAFPTLAALVASNDDSGGADLPRDPWARRLLARPVAVFHWAADLLWHRPDGPLARRDPHPQLLRLTGYAHADAGEHLPVYVQHWPERRAARPDGRERAGAGLVAGMAGRGAGAAALAPATARWPRPQAHRCLSGQCDWRKCRDGADGAAHLRPGRAGAADERGAAGYHVGLHHHPAGGGHSRGDGRILWYLALSGD
jgi:Lipid II flippase MurJ